jgi:hypothetical protein
MTPFHTTWTQYQGDSANSGYAALLTPFGLDNEGGSLPLPHINGSSPIVDPFDGSVYITDSIGTLRKFLPGGGAASWSLTVQENAFGRTPAIDSRGRIYSLFRWGTAYDASDWSAVLVCHDRDGHELWRYQPPRFHDEQFPSILEGCPKVYEMPDGHVFIFFLIRWIDYNGEVYHNLLALVNEQGIPQSTADFGITPLFGVAHGGGGFSARRQTVSRMRPSGLTRPPTGGLISTADAAPLPENTIYLNGWIAVFDNGPLDQPVIVATDGYSQIAAWRWQGFAGLVPLWQRDYAGDLGDTPGLSGPAVYPNGLLAVASHSTVRLLDPLSGVEWKPWPNIGGAIQSAPASFLRQMYVGTADGNVAMIDSNGAVVKVVNVGAQIVTPSLVTASNVFIMGAHHLFAFDLFLGNMISREFLSPDDNTGQSGLAIGPDGTMYFVALDSLVSVYPHPAFRTAVHGQGPQARPASS